MGFSPRWDPDFLLLFARMSGAAFREGSPLSWNDEALTTALEQVRAWSSEVNRSAADEDDFQFKYLYLPRNLSVQEGRIAFAYMDSSQFFLLSEERRAALDYRWIARGTAIPVLEEAVYAGILTVTTFASLGLRELLMLMAKTVSFGLLIPLICCNVGMSVGTSATEIPQAATRAVITSLFTVFLVDGLLTFAASLVPAA